MFRVFLEHYRRRLQATRFVDLKHMGLYSLKVCTKSYLFPQLIKFCVDIKLHIRSRLFPCTISRLEPLRFFEHLPVHKISENKRKIEYSIPEPAQTPSCQLPTTFKLKDVLVMKDNVEESLRDYSSTFPLKLPDGLECDFIDTLLCEADLDKIDKDL
jgi:hypothetical protein